MFKTVSTLAPRHIEALHRMFQNEWWARGRTLEETERVVRHSSVNIAILDTADDLIGYARVLSDYVFKAFIFDVIVRPDHRGRQLGLTILQAVLSHASLKDVKHFELYCLPEMAPFYARHGFAETGPLRLMRYEVKPDQIDI